MNSSPRRGSSRKRSAGRSASGSPGRRFGECGAGRSSRHRGHGSLRSLLGVRACSTDSLTPQPQGGGLSGEGLGLAATEEDPAPPRAGSRRPRPALTISVASDFAAGDESEAALYNEQNGPGSCRYHDGTRMPAAGWFQHVRITPAPSPA